MGSRAPAAADRSPARVAAVTRTGRALVLRGFGISGAFWGAFAVWLPDLQRVAGVSDGELGLALGGLAVAALPAMPVVGRLADRRGAAEALQLTLIASALSLPLLALATGLPGLVAALLVLGVTTGALDVALSAAAAEHERTGAPGERPLMSLAHGVFSFGVVGGSLAAGLVRERGLPPLPLLLLLAGVTAAVATRVPPHRPPPAAAAGPSRGLRGRPPLLWLLGLLVAASFVVEDGLQSWTPLHLERAVGASPALSALGVTAFAGAMGVGRLAGHVLGARLGQARLLIGGGLLGAVGVLLLVTAGTGPPALVGLALAGAGTSVLVPVLMTAVSERSPAGRQGEDLALVNGLGYVGFITGPPLVGVVSAATSLPVALGLLGLVAGLLAVVGPVLLRRGRTHAPTPTAGTATPGSGSR